MRGIFCGALAMLSGCGRAPSDAELDQWLGEARREETQHRVQSARAESATWTLSVRGNVKGGGVTYTWPQIEALATKRLSTTTVGPGQHGSTAVREFRGVDLNGLLESVEAREDDGPGGHELTVVAADGFRHTQKLAVVRRFPLLLAIEQDGIPLVRATGGPLLEVIPHTSHPASADLFPEGGTYYVTALIVGTEKLSLRVNGTVLEARDIEALPTKTVTGKVGFRARTPTPGIAVHGPTLLDVIARAGLPPLGGSDRVKVRRKLHTDTLPHEVMTLSTEDIASCEIVIATRWGEDRALIPASKGGPAVLAFPSACAGVTRGQSWPLFVEEITVVPGATGGLDAGADAGAGKGDGG